MSRVAVGSSFMRPRGYLLIMMTLSVMSLGLTESAQGQGLIRSKKPDRGVYRPPTISARDVKAVKVAPIDQVDPVDDYEFGDSSLVPAPIQNAGEQAPGDLPEPITDEFAGEVDTVSFEQDSRTLEPVNHEVVEQQLRPMGRSFAQRGDASSTGVQPAGHHAPGDGSCQSCNQSSGLRPQVIYEGVDGGDWIEGDYMPGGCDGGCDSMGCGRCAKGQWFGSLELLLMFRRGDRPPPLVTTSTDTDDDSAGEIGQANTTILVGEDSILKDMTAGARLTLGVWLDNYKDRSLVARGWFSGEESFGFSGNQDSFPVLTRPFFNVTDGETPEQDTQLVAFPDRATGELQLHADSNVYGADLSIRQLWYKKAGGTVDLLYGYQYMGLHESLSINSRSTSINDDFAPVGSVISVADSFDIENNFHGGQIGIATNYRERCWSFASLAKVGFGSLRRKAELNGVTTTSIDGVNAVDPNGLLVRSTNAGTRNDDTFAWVPELDFTLGWHRYPAFDLTFGYHLVVMTDALRVSGAIDPDLAVNLADPPTGAQNPTFSLSDDTFYIQGLHFGLSYIY